MATYFPDEEWRAVSAREPLSSEWDKAARLRSSLDMLRQDVGYPIGLTSFVRSSGTHPNGDAIDFQPAGFPPAIRATDPAKAREFSQRLEDMFNWLRTHPQRRSMFGVVIHERNHIHMTVPGFRGKYGEVYREPEEGVYTIVRENFHLLGVVFLVVLGYWFLTGKLA